MKCYYVIRIMARSMVVFQLFAVCLICCILLTAKVDCRQLDSYLHASQTRPLTLLQRPSDFRRSIRGYNGLYEPFDGSNYERRAEAIRSSRRPISFMNYWLNNKRNCRFNLGGHCDTENAAAVAAHWNYLDSPWSPGRRRKRVDPSADSAPRQRPAPSSFNVMYRQVAPLAADGGTARGQTPNVRRRCIRYLKRSETGELVPEVTCTVVRQHRKH